MTKPEEIAKLVSEQIKQNWINKVENFVVNSDLKLKNKIDLNDIQPNFYTGKTPEQVAVDLLKKQGE